MDLAMFYKWMKAKLPFSFEMGDLDSYTKYSRLSNTWELRFPMSHCPDYLRGKNRIIWLGENIHEQIDASNILPAVIQDISLTSVR
ncbi:Hypothetical protein PHPALM_21047 [Phytophthora palmivora]|uniref:Uncharacterized protein n=1 Tax=Phytophthora palmivora TaxID=4796 RepID=A0A2P4XDA6_9STRA|nr:Hypothetical protein PHPALM_21047 [Phytophthora palmivora]